MQACVCAESALEHYRSAFSPAGKEAETSRTVVPREAASLLRDLQVLSLVGLGIESPSPQHPIHVLVRRSEGQSRAKSVVPMVWSSPFPRGGLRKVSDDAYVSSPEFLFLQMARKLELVPLIELGMELCGTYRRNARDGETTYDQPALTTPQRLERFVEKAGSVGGAKRARQALKYVLPNSASPLETIVYLLLCLPRRLGGYAFPKPILNAAVKLSKRGREHTLRKSSVPDLYWWLAKLDLECHGKEHELQKRRTEDSMRRKALERMKVEVIELTYDEVKDPKLFGATARRIAKKIGVRFRSHETLGLEDREQSLRAALLPPERRPETLWQDPQASWSYEGAREASWEDNQAQWDVAEPYDAWVDELPPEYESWEVYLVGTMDDGTQEVL